jgi:hypothetical protein
MKAVNIINNQTDITVTGRKQRTQIITPKNKSIRQEMHLKKLLSSRGLNASYSEQRLRNSAFLIFEIDTTNRFLTWNSFR